MIKRRDMLKGAVAASALGSVKPWSAQAQLLFPDNMIPAIERAPSPPATPFVTPLFIPPVARPVAMEQLDPQPDPQRHQRYQDFPPQKFYTESLAETRWVYHLEPPYDRGSWSYTFNGITPGPTYHAYYGEPILVRRYNDLPAVGEGNIRWALPSFSIHLHNAHTASESDGIPSDYVDPGEFWDHHYGNFPAGNDPRERMSLLWYHDHRLDFTATNVYAGFSGFYLLFDREEDTGNEEDELATAFRLPSGDYDIPMILHDVQFDQEGQPLWDFFNPEPQFDPDIPPINRFNPSAGNFVPEGAFTTNGMLGDRLTVNRIIQPFLDVENRKYRFRVLNGGPSRFYNLALYHPARDRRETFHVISTDGNLLTEPRQAESILIAVAQRHDVIIDFSAYQPGDTLYLVNDLAMRPDGAGPSGGRLDLSDVTLNGVIQFNVVARQRPDPSRLPDRLRELPPVNMDEVRTEREFVFDYDNGLWTINGRLMDPNRVDAKIEQGSAEIWVLRNGGNNWSHPIHIHFEEHQILEKNLRPLPAESVQRSRKDVIRLGPTDEYRIFMRWRDFIGRHVMHCHNVVHEDHAMMLRWDIVPAGDGDCGAPCATPGEPFRSEALPGGAVRGRPDSGEPDEGGAGHD